jgi:hypothetical protein
VEYICSSGGNGMSRIARSTLCTAIEKVRAMSRDQKERLADELFAAQPHMLASFLVQKQMGVSLEKMEFLLEIVFICFMAMKESGLAWPLITEDEQDRQMERFIATMKFGDDLQGRLRDRAMQQYIESHPEKELLAFVFGEMNKWLQRIVAENADKYVMLTAINLVNCIAFVPMPTSK